MFTAVRVIGFSPKISIRSTSAADAVGLVTDQHGQLAVLGVHAGLQQLGCAANAGQRVLHLVCEDCRHAGDAARGAAERKLPVE